MPLLSRNGITLEWDGGRDFWTSYGIEGMYIIRFVYPISNFSSDELVCQVSSTGRLIGCGCLGKAAAIDLALELRSRCLDTCIDSSTQPSEAYSHLTSHNAFSHSTLTIFQVSWALS